MVVTVGYYYCVVLLYHDTNTDTHSSILSQTARIMLLGALIATAGVLIFAMTAAMGYVIFRM
jgi:hypothetical protein